MKRISSHQGVFKCVCLTVCKCKFYKGFPLFSSLCNLWYYDRFCRELINTNSNNIISSNVVTYWGCGDVIQGNVSLLGVPSLCLKHQLEVLNGWHQHHFLQPIWAMVTSAGHQNPSPASSVCNANSHTTLYYAVLRHHLLWAITGTYTNSLDNRYSPVIDLMLTYLISSRSLCLVGNKQMKPGKTFEGLIVEEVRWRIHILIKVGL